MEVERLKPPLNDKVKEDVVLTEKSRLFLFLKNVEGASDGFFFCENLL